MRVLPIKDRRRPQQRPGQSISRSGQTLVRWPPANELSVIHFASVENAALNWYEQEQKLKRQEKLSQAEIELDNQLETLKTEQRNRNPMLILDGDPAKNELSFGELAQEALDTIAAGIDDKRVRNAFISGARQTVNRKQISVNQDARNRLIDQRAATALQEAAKLEDDAVMGNGADRAEAVLKLFGGQDSSGNQVIGAYYQMAAEGLITNVKAQRDRGS